MKSFSIVALLLISISSIALAADPASGAPVAVPAFAPAAAAPAFTWTGFYAGLNGGGGKANFDRTGLYDDYDVNDSASSTGYFAGVQIGYNWQFSPRFVLGVEADYQGANFGHMFTCGAGYDAEAFCNDDSSVGGYDLRSFGSVRLRAGYANNNSLFYVTVGEGFGKVRYSAFDYLPDNSASADKNASGLAAGFGYEHGINTRWSVKLEYLYIDFGTNSMDPIPASTPDYVVDVKSHMSSLRFGVNYRFGSH